MTTFPRREVHVRTWAVAVLVAAAVGCSGRPPAPTSPPATPPGSAPAGDAPTGGAPTSTPPGAVPPAPAKASVLDGTVTYRERIALPADATVDVWVTDTSPGIVTMAILGETTVQADGRQVPLPFEVAIDPARVEPTHTYGARAVIRAGDRTLFESSEPTPVLTQGHPSTVALVLTRVSGDATPPSPSTATLVGTSWRLVDLAGTPAVTGAEATLEFPEAGRAAGRGSCNRFFGPVTIEGATIAFGALAATKMACADTAANAQETRYLAALGDAERFEVQGATLRIQVKGAASPLVFTRLTP